MTLASATSWIAGLFLHQAADAFINFSYSQYEEGRENRSLSPAESWRDRMAVLTYWHEVDHFQSFACSPYLTFATDILEAYSSSCSSALTAVAESGNWPSFTKPIQLAWGRGECKDLGNLDLFMNTASSFRMAAHCLLNAPFLSHRIANRITGAARRQASFKLVELDFDCRLGSDTLDSRDLGITPIDLLEASARLHELGHLVVWGANQQQIDQWASDLLFDQYGKVLIPLMGEVDTDLIHACIALAFRADFFPFLGGEYKLVEVHPVTRFLAMINYLEKHKLARAQGSDGRNTDTRSAFHDKAVEALVEVYGRVSSGQRFQQSTDALWINFIDGELRDLLRPEQVDYIDSLLIEKRNLASLRDARLERELAEPYWLWGEPTVFPFKVIFTDSIRTTRGVVLKTGDVMTDFGGTHLAIATTQSVNEIVLYGDNRLYDLLTKVLGVPGRPTHFLLEILEPKGLIEGWQELPVIPWSDDQFDYAFTE